MKNLVEIKNDQVVVSSVDVARNFEKRHNNLMRDIDTIIEDCSILSSAKQMFLKSTYTNENNREFDCYLMNRDGFSLLVMGFTGTKALEWKVKYIQAFNQMEKQLKESQVALIPNFSNPAEAARAWADQYEARLKAESENKLLAPKASYTDNVLSSEGYMTATQIAKDYGKSAKWLNKLLHVEGIQYKSGNQWILYAKYADKGYTVSGTCVVGDNSYVSTYWTQEGRKFIYDLIKEKYGLTPRNEE